MNPVTSRDYNARVAEAARRQPLRGYTRDDSVAATHHWSISFRRTADPSRRWWAVFVAPGAVNDKLACITYARTNDPRGWTMPPDHPGIPMAEALYGPDFKLIDRRLTERQDPPHILVQSPSSSPADLGDFERVPDADRLPLPFFRTAAMWQRDLYRASVFLTAQPVAYSRAETLFHLPLVARPSRFRVGVAPRLPARTVGTQAGGVKELAQLFLTRDPRSPDPVRSDVLYARERCFFSLGTANSEPNPFGPFNPLPPVDILTGPIIGLTASLGLASALAAGTAFAINQILDDALLAIGGNLAASSAVEFWSAA